MGVCLFGHIPNFIGYYTMSFAFPKFFSIGRIKEHVELITRIRPFDRFIMSIRWSLWKANRSILPCLFLSTHGDYENRNYPQTVSRPIWFTTSILVAIVTST